MPSPHPLQPPEEAPPFSYVEGRAEVRSDRLRRPHLLYFYPKDDTPGCTREACAFRDAWTEFEAAGLKVVGVSPDTEASHEKFRRKHQLPFPLIADAGAALARAFGVYGEKKFMGRSHEGVHRVSFLISPEGRILKTYPKVKPDEHARQVLEDLSTPTD